MRFPLLVRMLTIGAVAAAILVPIALIQGKVQERRARASGVEAQFARETSGAQAIAGPFLALVCEETYTAEREIMRGGKAETISEQRIRPCPTSYVAPRILKGTAHLPVESLHRGIYPIRLYRAKVHLGGELEWPAPPSAPAGATRAWKQASLVMMVSDARGIRELRAKPEPSQARGGQSADGRFALRSELGEYSAAKEREKLPFDITMELVGTSSLSIAPVGDATQLSVTSDWPHPSFMGSWSPDERRIDAKGFEASWRVTHHATGGQAAWEGLARSGKLAQAVAGVALVEPVNVYSLSYRATEYGFLFVLFTFGALAITEVVARVRIHPVQYLLVGSALAVFFLLLLAGSEHVAFGAAYGVSAAAAIALLTFYLRHPLGSLRRAGTFAGLFAAMYGSLYVLLNSEDHALLMGSVMAFALLAVAMVATRRVDWSARTVVPA